MTAELEAEVAALKLEINTLATNHIAHVQEDIHSIRLDMAVMNERVKALETFNTDIKDFIKGHTQKITSYLVAIVAAGLGITTQM